MDPHPLIFAPIFRPKVWGGRRLADLLGKPLPPDVAVGESWECADLPSGQSVVAAGPARGRTLGQLVAEWGRDLIGRAALASGRFPLVIKFLDAREPLSIQVHPGDRRREERPPMNPRFELGELDTARLASDGARPTATGPMPVSTPAIKHEAWYVIHADPDAVIYRGLRPGVTRAQVRRVAGTEEIGNLVQAVPVKPDQVLYCPGGTVHALGGGIVAAEVQTTSDVTYRLYDWGRQRPPGDEGLNIEESLQAIDWDAPSVEMPPRSHVGGLFTTVTRVLKCPAFQIEKVRFVEGMELDIPYAELVIWIVLEGRGAVLYGRGEATAFGRGDVVLLPAGLKNGRLRTETACVWLEVTIPTASDLANFGRPSAESLREGPGTPNKMVSLGISGAERHGP